MIFAALFPREAPNQSASVEPASERANHAADTSLPPPTPTPPVERVFPKRLDAALLQSLLPRVERAVYAAVGRRDGEAEDLMSACFAELIRSHKNYRGDGPPEAFVDRLTYRVLMRQLKRRRRRERTVLVSDQLDIHEDGLAEAAANSDGHAVIPPALQVVLNQLSPEDRMAVIHKVVLGYSVAEVGEMAGAPTNTVRGRLRRGLAQLRNLLGADSAMQQRGSRDE